MSTSLRALVYHRVEDPGAPRADLAPALVEADPARLERHLRHLTRFYCPVGADEVLAALAGRHRLPPRAVLVTFDDGYRDFQELAWPILKRHRVPAVLFVPTAFVEQPERVFWWDALWQALARTDRREVAPPGHGALPLATYPERVVASRRLAEWLKTLGPAALAAMVERLLEQLGVRPEPTGAVLSWTELRRLADDGLSVAAHSRTHDLLDGLDGAALAREVDGCRADLVRELGPCPPLFAYPYGRFSGQAAQALERAGFRAGFTVAHGLNHLPTADPRLLRRDQGGVSSFRFALHLLRPLAALRVARHPLPRYPRAEATAS